MKRHLPRWAALMMTAFGAIYTAKADADSNEVARLPAVVVTPLTESQPVGPYQQPKWTSGGQIGGVSTYVVPAWNAELSQRWFPELDRDNTVDNAFNEEIEVGLPHRFQADFNENWGVDTRGFVEQRGFGLEARYALADWNVIPLNPTLYAEWEFNNQFSEHGVGDAYELKLLLSEQFGQRWHWALNGIYEQQVGGERATEFKVTQALTYTLIDDKLNVGVEMQFEDTTTQDDRSPAEIEFSPGPSVSWRPTPHTHLDVVALFGCTGYAPTFEGVVVFGIEVGMGGEHETIEPASSRGR